MSPYAAVLGGVLVVAALVAFLAVALRVRGTAAPRWGFLSRLWFVAVWLGVVALSVTVALVVFSSAENALRGWPLLVHASLGGAVLVGLAGLALGFARSARTGAGWRWGPVGRTCFWTSLVAGTVAGATILVSTLPVFGTEAMHGLIDVHRWAGLALAVAFVMLSGLSLRRPGATGAVKR